MAKTAKLEFEIDSALQARFLDAVSAIDAKPGDVIADLMREFVDDQDVEVEEGYWEFVAKKVEKARLDVEEGRLLDSDEVEERFRRLRANLSRGKAA